MKGIFVFPTALLGVAPVCYLDNVWSMAKNRAHDMGVVLAEDFLEKKTNRPLSLVAYSLGCLSVLSLMDTLIEKGEHTYVNGIGMIENGNSSIMDYNH